MKVIYGKRQKLRQNSYTPPFLHTQRKGAQKTNHLPQKIVLVCLFFFANKINFLEQIFSLTMDEK